MGGTPTATCADCDIGWRGQVAHEEGRDHEKITGHVVWYDEDPDEPWPGESWFGRVIWAEPNVHLTSNGVDRLSEKITRR